MPDPRAQRTLVKSPPELWAEISDVGTLARHLGEFGEIRITRTEAETTVVWEGDRARGTVELEPAGWGTKVTITAEAVEGVAAPEATAEVAEVAADEEPEVVEDLPEAVAAPEAEQLEPVEAPRRGLFARLFGWRRRVAEPAPEAAAAEAVAAQPEPLAAQPEPVAPPAPAVAPEPVAAQPAPAPALEPDRIEAVLVGVLDDLGAAHHRPFSRG